MPKFGEVSQRRLNTCHKDLIFICNEVIEHFDFSVLEGHRDLYTQMKYFEQGKSKLDGVRNKSKHQSLPSMAIDIVPYPIDFEDTKRFYMLAGYMFMASEYLYENGIITHKLRWGGDFNMNQDFNDDNFLDLPHFELIKG